MKYLTFITGFLFMSFLLAGQTGYSIRPDLGFDNTWHINTNGSHFNDGAIHSGGTDGSTSPRQVPQHTGEPKRGMDEEFSSLASVNDNGNDCGKIDTVEVFSAQDSIELINIIIQNSYCPFSKDGSVRLKVNGAKRAEWEHDGVSSFFREDLAPGTYKVTLYESKNNPGIKLKVHLCSENEKCITIPTAFSPNNDGVNDKWRLKNLREYYPNATIQVFNRQGEQVFYSKGYEEAWDGTYNGNLLPVDSYFYIIDLNNGEKPLRGQVTILK